MSLKHYLIFMGAATLLCWLAWIMVVWGVNPGGAGTGGFFLFYISFFLALLGTLSLAGFVIRIIFRPPGQPHFRTVKKAFRQSIFFAGLLVCAFFLQSQRLLNWWNVIALVAAFVFFELFFLSRR
ncbi:MAG: hypothetical protein HY982_00405 [Candidatus Magasanikbacteria bacterium]|nr:hypothetical protein [Candidatus Magasanikbacteria bacterium]